MQLLSSPASQVLGFAVALFTDLPIPEHICSSETTPRNIAACKSATRKSMRKSPSEQKKHPCLWDISGDDSQQVLTAFQQKYKESTKTHRDLQKKTQIPHDTSKFPQGVKPLISSFAPTTLHRASQVFAIVSDRWGKWCCGGCRAYGGCRWRVL